MLNDPLVLFSVYIMPNCSWMKKKRLNFSTHSPSVWHISGIILNCLSFQFIGSSWNWMLQVKNRLFSHRITRYCNGWSSLGQVFSFAFLFSWAREYTCMIMWTYHLFQVNCFLLFPFCILFSFISLALHFLRDACGASSYSCFQSAKFISTTRLSMH